ncbi:MAG: hypothetical protein C5B59_19915 [Bacteroidetes bacterium]|nr:MAG: hypothetical protein C5B59_19915 [Bacteroidota bacterium]
MNKISGALLILILGSISLFAQDVKFISLKNEKISAPLKNYFIASVKDERADTSNIGSIKNGLLGKKNQTLNLQNGASSAMFQFIRNNVIQDTSASPIEMHITKFKVVANGTSGLKTENELTISLAFYHDTSKLFETTGGGITETTGDATKLIEELIRGSMQTMLQQFDEWWAKNKSYYLAIRTKPTIKVEVSLEQDLDNPDIISYSPKRPLTLDDFQGKPTESGSTVAITYSIVMMKYSTARTANNEIFVDVYVLTNFSKSKSWCRSEHRNAETLEHEQRHFDISAIKACELVDTIRKFTFSVDGFPSELQRIQRIKQNELDKMQEQYDAETRHGNGPLTQEKWNKLIKEKLESISCFSS